MTRKLEAVKGKKPTRVPTTTMVPTASINEAPYNPRFMPPEVMAALKASIRKHGLVLNPVVQKRGMILIGGHQRLRALREVAEEDGTEVPTELPCVVLDVGDAEAKQLNVALNKIEGEFDPYKLGAVFASIREDMTMEDISATGFTADEFEQAIHLISPMDDQVLDTEAEFGDGVNAFAKSITLTIEFDTVKQRDEAKELLKQVSQDSKTKPGKIVLAALKARSVASPSRKTKKRAA